MAGSPPTIKRAFGIINDAVSSGSDYETLTSGAIPDATGMWIPAQSDNLDKNPEWIERTDEMRGIRSAPPRLPFKQAPSMSVGFRAYPSVMRQMVRRCFGVAGVVTGSGPYTEAFTPAPAGTAVLPACHAQLIRDDLNHKMSGAYIESLAMSFGDQDGTVEAVLRGLYQKHDVAAQPTPSFSGLSENPLMLRDAQVFVDGSVTALANLEGFDFSYNNNLPAPHHQPGRNVILQSIGSPALNRKLWFPQHYRLNSIPDVSFELRFGQGIAAQELAHDYGQVQKLVLEVSGDPITPSGVEIMRITIYAGVYGSGGPEAGSARDDLSSGYQGNAFYSTADANDVKIEFVKQASGATALV